jgi:hypothetical protein
MSDIFISYERSDQPQAEMLVERLGKRGWSIFWDRTIPIGSTWRKTIGKELNDARCVVVLWSETSVESVWVHDEADDARRRGILVPVLIDDIQAPIGFRSIQTGNLANWDGAESTTAFQRLVIDITALIGSPPKLAGEEGERPAAAIEHYAESNRVRSKAEPDSEVRSTADEVAEARRKSESSAANTLGSPQGDSELAPLRAKLSRFSTCETSLAA